MRCTHPVAAAKRDAATGYYRDNPVKPTSLTLDDMVDSDPKLTSTSDLQAFMATHALAAAALLTLTHALNMPLLHTANANVPERLPRRFNLLSCTTTLMKFVWLPPLPTSSNLFTLCPTATGRSTGSVLLTLLIPPHGKPAHPRCFPTPPRTCSLPKGRSWSVTSLGIKTALCFTRDGAPPSGPPFSPMRAASRRGFQFSRRHG